MMTIGDMLRRQAAARPHAPAVTCAEGTWTWRELNGRVNRLAGFLERELAHGDRVAITARNCHRYFELYLACAKASVVAVPINHRLRSNEMAYIAQDSGARMWFADDQLAASALEAVEQGDVSARLIGWNTEDLELDYESIIGEHADVEPEPANRWDDVSVIGYTSGTTGKPKGAKLSHRMLVLSALEYAVHHHLGPDDVSLACMPAYVHRGGSQAFATMFAGGHTVTSSFEAGEILRLIDEHRVTYLLVAPVMLGRLLDHPDAARRSLSSVRSLWVASAPVNSSLLERAERRFGEGVTGTAYGLTEATAITMVKHVAEGGRWNSVGRPTVVGDVRITRDPSGPGADEIGEVWVRGPCVMEGYWHDDAKTEAAFSNGWFKTGDVGRIDEDGYLYLMDRRADVIISGGLNVYSTEVEAVLAQHEAVAECTVIGTPDETWGELVTAIVVLASATSASDLTAFCREQLGGFKVPRRFVFLGEALPRNTMGKVDKLALKERCGAGPFVDGKSAAQQSADLSRTG